MFEKCCLSPNKQKYDIKHTPQPIELNETLLAAIERLLWYVPNIDSKQSPKNDLLMNSLYGNYYLGIILENIGIGKQDVYWTNHIDPDLVKEYQEEVCINCQKLVLKIAKSIEFNGFKWEELDYIHDLTLEILRTKTD